MSWLSSAFKGSKNPADSAMPYLDQIPGQTNQYYQPYFQAGQQVLPHLQSEYNSLSRGRPQLQNQYESLINNPGSRLNEIGANFHESPGFQFALQQALEGANHAAAAGGMAGSPENQQHNIEVGTQLGNQEYNDWMHKALGLYGTGLQGEEGLYNTGLQGQQRFAGMGQQAGNSLGDMIAQTLAQQGNLAFQGQRQQNQNKNDLWGNIFKGAGTALSAFSPFSGSGSNMGGGR